MKKNLRSFKLPALLSFIFAFILSGSNAQVTDVFTTAGTNTWVCPSGVTSVTVQSWGGGGAGGGVSTAGSIQAGGGGGGGAFNIATAVSVTPGSSYIVFVGSGGAAVVGANGGNGAASYFDISTANANGGSGGVANNGTGGAGGSGGFTTGGNGGASSAGTSGGGGGGGGTTAGGGSGSAPAAGTGGTTGGGAGAVGSSATGAGTAGSAPGGGGSGARKGTGAATSAGGAGGGGKVTISYTVAPLCGVYHVGSAQPVPFNTITNAITRLNGAGVSCAVTFLLDDALYSTSETYPITISVFPGASATNTFTLKPNVGQTTTVTGSPISPNGIFHIEGNYITIDGSNASGGTSRDLTVTNVNATGAGGTPYCIHGQSIAAGTAIHDIVVKNCITNNDQTSSTGDIVFTANTATAGSLDPGYFYNITIQNNDIRKCNIGIAVLGVYTSGNATGITITKNIMTSTFANSVYLYGMLLAGLDGASIDNNTMSNFNASDGFDDVGIYLGTAKNTTITNNLITNLKNTNALGYGSRGMLIATGLSGANVTIANNMIAGITGLGYNYTSATYTLDNPCGILLSGTQTGINIYHNSINMDGGGGNTLNSTNALSAGIRLYGSSTADIRNNIIVNNLGGTGYGAVGILTPAASQFSLLDNNVYYVAPTTATNRLIGQVLTTGQTTLAGWQAATGKEVEGVNAQPTFTSGTDLHLTPSPSTINFLVNNEGQPLPAITVDIDGDARNAYSPDPGADEFKGTGSWIGKTSTVWELPGNTAPGGNWDDGTVPASALNVKVYRAPNQPTINAVTGNAPLASLYMKTPGYITVTGGTGALQVYNNFNIRPSGYIDASGGTLDMEGTASQNIPAGLLVGNSLKNFIIGNSESSTGVNMAGPISVYRSLTFTGAGLKLTTNDNLTIKSLAAETAWVGDMTGKTVTGNVSVERYFSYLRKWQYLSVPTDNALQTFKAAWQEGAASLSSNPNPGYGIEITQMLSGTGVGFDASSYTPSVKIYNSATNDYTGIANTTDYIKTTGGYMTFVRGDRLSIGTSTTPTNPTTLRTKGLLYVGTQPSIAVPSGLIKGIGNPYACAINLTALSMTGLIGTSPTKGTVYLWDPSLTAGTLYGLGGFEVLTYNTSTSTFDVTPGGTASGSLIYSATNKRIESGQAFFVQGASGGGTVTFGEAAKTSASNLVSFTGGAGEPVYDMTKTMRINLYAMPNGNPALVDGTLTYFNNEFNSGADEMDARKMSNTSENVSISSSGRLLTVDYRAMPDVNDSIFINTANTYAQNYRWKLFTAGLTADGTDAFLIDKYLKTSTPIDANGATVYDFNVANIAGSYAADRFVIVFRKAVISPVKYTLITAARNNYKTATVKWTVGNEAGLLAHEIERSEDGVNFKKTGSVAAQNSGGTAFYSYIDGGASLNKTYYRIKSAGNNGLYTYSDVASLDAVGASHIAVYPNPVEGKTAHLQQFNIPAGKYALIIYDAAGKKVYGGTVHATELIQAENINLKNISSGNYILTLKKGEDIFNIPMSIQN